MVNLTAILKIREGFLEKEPVFKIAARLGALSRRWLDKKFSYRQKAVRRLTEDGFSSDMAEAMLDSLFKEMTRDKLLRLLKSEFRDSKVLDGFRREIGRSVRARGPKVIVHIFSGNVPAPAVVSFVLGMLVKSVNIGKVSSRSRGILDIYLESLKILEPRLARTNLLMAANDRAGVQRLMQQAQLVVAYGDDHTLKELKKHAPTGALFCGYGTKKSAAFYSSRAHGVERALKNTARDIWMSDQRGCLSPLEIFIEKGGELTLEDFSQKLLTALEKKYGFRGWRLPGRGFQVLGMGARKIARVCQVQNERDFLKILAPHHKQLQAVSIETANDLRRRMTLAEALSKLGANRLCRAGRMQEPPMTWHHDGFPNIASWVRWTDLE